MKPRSVGRVLVTDGRERSSLAVVRSLGRSGIQVTVASERLPALASVSRFCARSIQIPSPRTHPEQFVGALLTEVERSSYDLLIPMTDVTSILTAEHADQFRMHVRVPLPDREVFRQALDKEKVARLAQQLDVPVPRTWIVDSPKELAAVAAEFTYPLVLKPRSSKYLTKSGWISEPVTYVDSLDKLQAALGSYHPAVPLPMIQERVDGPGCGAFFLFDKGEPKAAFFHRRIREKPPSGGVSVFRESIPVDPDLKRYGEQLLIALRWHGVAMVEFKRDLRDGRPKIMEINPRFWGSLQLAIDAGVDFPRLLYDMETGGRIEPVRDYIVPMRSRWLLGDLDHLSARLRKSNKQLQVSEDYPGRLTTLLQFLRFLQPDMRYEVNRTDDLRPFLHEVKEYVLDLLRRRVPDSQN